MKQTTTAYLVYSVHIKVRVDGDAQGLDRIARDTRRHIGLVGPILNEVLDDTMIVNFEKFTSIDVVSEE